MEDIIKKVHKDNPMLSYASTDSIKAVVDECLKQKQSDIDELVAYLKNYNHLTKLDINELIQKHTKK